MNNNPPNPTPSVTERSVFDAFLAGYAQASGAMSVADLKDGVTYHAAHIGAQAYVAALAMSAKGDGR